jgi:hypothetical protein
MDGWVGQGSESQRGCNPCGLQNHSAPKPDPGSGGRDSSPAKRADGPDGGGGTYTKERGPGSTRSPKLACAWSGVSTARRPYSLTRPTAPGEEGCLKLPDDAPLPAQDPIPGPLPPVWALRPLQQILLHSGLQLNRRMWGFPPF